MNQLSMMLSTTGLFRFVNIIIANAATLISQQNQLKDEAFLSSMSKLALSGEPRFELM
jgi:hypothetical protein